MEFKIGDYVTNVKKDTIIDKDCKYSKNLKNSIGKIVNIKKYSSSISYSIVFISCPYIKNCRRCNNTKVPYCKGYDNKNYFKSLNTLKLKKLIEHGV